VTAQIIPNTRWQIQRTKPQPGHVVLGNACRPAMVVGANGQLVERRG
jgi:hypothetical protein